MWFKAVIHQAGRGSKEEEYDGTNKVLCEIAGVTEIDTLEKAEKLMKKTVDEFNRTFPLKGKKRLAKIEWCKKEEECQE